MTRAAVRSAVLTLAAAATLALAGCGTEASTAPAAAPVTASPAVPAAPAAPSTPAAQPVRITVADGKVIGGLASVRAPLGSPVSLVVTSDRDDEAHLHGYDRTIELTAGTPAALQFTADTPGVFEFELHGADLQLARIEVR